MPRRRQDSTEEIRAVGFAAKVLELLSELGSEAERSTLNQNRDRRVVHPEPDADQIHILKGICALHHHP